VGADVREVRFGIGADHRIGYHFIYPGVGYGGSCFPKDVKALINTADDSGYQPRLLMAVDLVNDTQKMVLPLKIENYFETKGGLAGKTLALWGLAFKPNTDDIREAPAGVLINYLTQKGMHIKAYDPAAGPKTREDFQDNKLLEIKAKQYDVLEGADALAIVTEWNQFRSMDWALVKKQLKQSVVFDGRNLYSPRSMAENGLTYFCIGRTSYGSR
jgi:UDPglucose 6-dehydrogenase